MKVGFAHSRPRPLTTSVRLYCLLLALCAAVLTAMPAAATSPENVEALRQHFQSLGEISHEIYAPLGGPELGVALIGDGSAARLHVTRVGERGQLESVLTEQISSEGGAAPFAFIQGGQHLLTYTTSSFFTADGQRRRGDIVIRDISAEGGPKKLFELSGLVDASYQIGDRKFQDNLVWQAAPHFLNNSGRLPVKNNYSRLLWDDIAGDYKLTQHLTALPDAEKVGAANLNNRAILYYRAGRLADAEILFSQAAGLAHDGQSIILHNNELVNSEIEDFERQRRLKAIDRPFDDALMYYWQGRYKDALRVLTPRFRKGATSDMYDAGLLVLALAREKRWAEVKGHIRRVPTDAPIYGELLGELVQIARLQGENSETVMVEYLRALEQTDTRNQYYAVGLATLSVRVDQTDEARRTLETYLRTAGDRDTTEARLMLYEMLQQTGAPGSDTLLSAAAAAPLRNLYAYALLADYVDLRAAQSDVALDEMTTFKVEGQLDSLGFFENEAQLD